MAVNIRTNPKEFPKLIQRQLRTAPRAVKRGMAKGARRGRMIMVRRTPKDEGHAKAGWKVRTKPNVVLFNDAPHISILEKGARPHPVGKKGIMALYRWVYRHRSSFNIKVKKRPKRIRKSKTKSEGGGIIPEIMAIAQAIAWKIRRHGAEPKYFVLGSLPDLQRAMIEEINKTLNKHASIRHKTLYGPGF